MQEQDPRRIVADGYDRMAERFAAWNVVDEPRGRYLRLILNRVPAGAQVLDLGSGGGASTSQELAKAFSLTGVDISARQIEMARRQVPDATFIHGDMTHLEFAPSSFAAVIAFYSLTHLPAGELPALLPRIATWLQPGGLFVASMSMHANAGEIEDDWLGVPMYFSGYNAEENVQLVLQAGLTIESAKPEIIHEEGIPVTFLWVVATKPYPGRIRNNSPTCG